MSSILLCAAVLPVFGLCTFIYTKDKNKEPAWLLALMFGLGLLSVIPVLICELIFGAFFPLDSKAGFIPIFFNILFGVALYEEAFKWLVTKYMGYRSKEFDEVFDVIVYAVFVSLGFACLENIMYVFQNGLGNAILRAILAVPGHTCFAISMGYFFSKAKVGQISGNHKVYAKNMILSIIAPIILHTFYDTFILAASGAEDSIIGLIPFILFYVFMVVVCFLTVDKVAKVQNNLSLNIQEGSIVKNDQGYIYYQYPTVPPTPPVATPAVETPLPPTTGPQFCPICGRQVAGANFCPNCGLRLR